jgi:hypothetical protein
VRNVSTNWNSGSEAVFVVRLEELNHDRESLSALLTFAETQYEVTGAEVEYGGGAGAEAEAPAPTDHHAPPGIAGRSRRETEAASDPDGEPCDSLR